MDEFCTFRINGIPGVVVCATRERRSKRRFIAHPRPGAESGGDDDRPSSVLFVPIITGQHATRFAY